MRRAVVGIACVLALAAGTPAQGKSEQGKGQGAKEHPAHGKPGKSGGGAAAAPRFSDRDRDLFEDWWDAEYGRGHCPPGLAKKRNGCLPPGQAKKRYALGQPLPDGVVLLPLPSSLARILGSPGAGHRYGMVDGDVVELALGSMRVVDALGGLLD